MTPAGSATNCKFGRRGAASPARRIRPALLYGVPLANALALAALCAALMGRTVTAPSMPLLLPADEFIAGATAAAEATLVVTAEGEPPLLFFDGIRYRLGVSEEREALRQALEDSRREFGWDAVTLFADGRAPHADVMRFAAAARRAGAAAVNIAVRGEGEAVQ